LGLSLLSPSLSSGPPFPFPPFFFGTATFPSWLQGLITLFSLDGDEDGVEDGDREPCVAMAQQLGHERIEIWLSVWY